MSSKQSMLLQIDAALTIARRVLSGELGVIEGSIKLNGYAYRMVRKGVRDRDFRTFDDVDCDTDHLPLGVVRSYWSANALAKVDIELESIARRHRAQVFQACENLLERFAGATPSGYHCVVLYRSVGQEELDLIAASGWTVLPARLPRQSTIDLFTTEAHAVQVARDWEAKDSGAGFVIRLDVDGDYLVRYPVQTVGGSALQAYWIPAEDLEEFNRQLLDTITVVAEFSRRRKGNES
jgi:hypothetical protein